MATTIVAVSSTTASNQTYSAVETDDDPVFADDLIVAAGVALSVTGAGGTLDLFAGDDVILDAGSQVSSAGTVAIVAGNGDLDGGGGFVSQGQISAPVVNVQAIGNIQPGWVTSAGSVSINTSAGSIIDNQTAFADINGASLALSAATGIGTLADALETDVVNLEAQSATGGIFITETNDLRVGGVSGPLTGVRATTSGDINITVTGGSLILDGTDAEDIRTTSGNVRVDASLDVEVRNGSTDGIDSDNGNVTILAGRDILLGSAATDRIGDVEATGSLTLNAGRDVIIDENTRVETFAPSFYGGALSVTAGRNIAILASDGTTGASIVTDGTGPITLTTGANGLLTVDSDNALGAIRGGHIAINADGLDITAGDSVRAPSGLVTIAPATAGRAIDLGSTTNLAPDTLEISDAEFDRIFAGSSVGTGTGGITIGNLSSGDITVSSAIAPGNMLSGNIELVSGGDITVNADLLLGSAGRINISAGDNFIAAAGVTVAASFIRIDADGDDPGVGGTADLRNATAGGTSAVLGAILTVSGGADDDTIFGGANAGVFGGGSGNDFIEAGGELFGHDGDDILIGGLSGDTIFAGNDDDRIEGGGGNDTLHGNAGDDTFVYRPGADDDFITDFVAGANTDDRLDLTAFTNIRTLQDALAFAVQDGSTTVFNFGNGDTLRLSNTLKSSLTVSDFVGLTVAPPAEDFNFDGTDDVLWRHDSGPVALWQMQGGQVALARGLGSIGPGWLAVESGDFDGDGTTDVLWRHDSGGLAAWQMQGGQVSVERGLGFMPPDWSVAGSGDFDGDGTGDILWRHDSGPVRIWEMQAGTRGAERDIGAFDATWRVAETGDFNGDDSSDILWQHDSGALVLWEMRNGGVAIERGLGVADPTWDLAAAGDITGDGTDDLLWRLDEGFVVSWEMNGGTLAVARGIGFFDPGWTLADARDVTGNGTDDILWHHVSGGVASWEMAGGVVAVERGLGLFDPSWEIVA